MGQPNYFTMSASLGDNYKASSDEYVLLRGLGGTSAYAEHLRGYIDGANIFEAGSENGGAYNQNSGAGLYQAKKDSLVSMSGGYSRAICSIPSIPNPPTKYTLSARYLRRVA